MRRGHVCGTLGIYCKKELEGMWSGRMLSPLVILVEPDNVELVQGSLVAWKEAHIWHLGRLGHIDLRFSGTSALQHLSI